MRNFNHIINQIMLVIPKDETDLLHAIKSVVNEYEYSPPESTIPWDKMFKTLQMYIAQPRKMWEVNVWSIFSEIPVDEIIEQIEGFKD